MKTLIKVVGLTLGLFVGLVAYFAWLIFWFNLSADRDWPFWLCFPMALLPVLAGLVVRWFKTRASEDF